MPLPNLSDFTDRLDNTVDAYLGEEITYEPSGGTAAPLQAHIDYGDEAQDFGAGNVVDQQIMVEITKSLLSAKPADGDRLTNLRRAPGMTFKPSGEPTTSRTGTRWKFKLKVVN